MDDGIDDSLLMDRNRNQNRNQNQNDDDGDDTITLEQADGTRTAGGLLGLTSGVRVEGTGAGTGVGVSPLEQEVLDEYERLLGNMDLLSTTLSSLATGPVTLEIADSLRLLERKVTSVYTLMKASVYSIVLQQGQTDGDGDGFSRLDATGDDGMGDTSVAGYR